MARFISSKVFPPTTSASVAAAETKLGFRLPDLLRDIYTQVANGGFGPGYGLIGLDDGAHDDLGKSITDLYFSYKQRDPDDPLWYWPDRLVPICHWGCAVYSCVDCSQPTAPVIYFDPNLHENGQRWDDSFIPHMSSFNKWIEAWLDDVNLWEDFSWGASLNRQLKELLRQGKKISAILLYQKHKSCSLEEARRYIESL